MALTLSWTLLNKHPSMVDGDGLLLGRGVWVMSFVIVCIECWQKTKYDAFDTTKGLACDKCGAKL